MGALLLAAISGFLVLLVLPVLPSPWWCVAVGAAASLLSYRVFISSQARRYALMPLVFGLGLAYAVLVADRTLSLWVAPQQEGRSLEVQGRIDGLPEPAWYGVRFRFQPDEDAALQGRWLLYAGPEVAARLRPGLRCRVEVKLKRPHGNANPGGFDYEAWLLSEGITGTGSATVLACSGHMSGVDSVRWALRQALQDAFPDDPQAGVLLALITGDRSAIPEAMWERFIDTGVVHLMAISGLHITMLAWVARWLALVVLRRFPRLGLGMPLQKPSWVIGGLVALAYSLIAGFSIPTQRTLLMLAVVVVLQCRERQLPVFHVLGCGLLAVLLWSPLAVHAAGFWLSFGAVALLMLLGKTHEHLPLWRQAIALQLSLCVWLLPLTLWLFERVSWVSPFANLLAVPVISVAVVPLGIAGFCLWLCGFNSLALLCWQGGVALLSVLDQLLMQWQAWPAANVSLSLPGLSGLCALFLLLFCLLQPLWPVWRWLLLPLGMYLVWPAAMAPVQGLRLTTWDVGQGLSVLIETPSHRLLYDAGPMLGKSANAGQRIIVPALHQQGIYQLDMLLLSHDDNDHTGGAPAIVQNLHVGQGLGVRPRGVKDLPPWQACRAGQHWLWDGWLFDILYPEAEEPGLAPDDDNNRSCVLRVSRGQAAVLLPGDAEAPSEQRLLARMSAEALHADVLLLGHHGSRNASTPDWLAAVQPRWALISAGYRNRFRHPSPRVLERLAEQGVDWRSTAVSGALTVELDEQGITHLEGYRQRARHYWQLADNTAIFAHP